MPAETSARKVRYACGSCGKVGFYPAGQPIVCKSCGAPADPAMAAAPASAPLASAAITTPPTPPASASPPAATSVEHDSSTLLGIVSLVAGLAAIVSAWALPLAGLIALAAIGTGIVALSRRSPDHGTNAMAVVGLILGVLSLFIALFFWTLFADSSNDGWTWNWTWWGWGGSGSDSGSSGHDDGIDIPGPLAPMVALGILALGAVIRRREP